MALDFPSPPFDGEIYTDPTTGSKYIYEAATTKWKSIQHTGVIVAYGFDKANAGFLVANSAYDTTNVAFASINSNWTVTNTVYGVANAAFDSANNVGPQIAPTYNTANAAYDTSNTNYNTTNVAFASINSNWTVTNTVYGITNSAYASINSNWTVTNTVYDVANAAFGSANNVAPQVTPAYNTANAAYNTANAAFDAANNVAPQIAPAYNTANTVYNQSNVVFGTVNAAFDKANTALQNTTGTFAGTLTVTGNIVMGGGTTVGYLQIPQNAQTSAYILVASDSGKHISITTGGVTVNASVFSVGDTVLIYNNSGSNQTITQGTNVTLRLSGTATTGNRTLAQYGTATLLCVTGGANPVFVISGSGLS